MGTITSGPFFEADGEVTVGLGREVNNQWHEITISVLNAVGQPASPPTVVTGTMTGRVLKTGADRVETFAQTLDLAAEDRSWQPTLSQAEVFLFSVSGLNAHFAYTVTINSWGTR